MNPLKIVSKLPPDQLQSFARSILSELDGARSAAARSTNAAADPAYSEKTAPADLYALASALAAASESAPLPDSSKAAPMIRAASGFLTAIRALSALTANISNSAAPADPAAGSHLFYDLPLLGLTRQPDSASASNDPATPPGSPPGVIDPNPAAALSDHTGLMSNVSDFFQRDSRRYDGGFERF